jgi:CheY-like chemotaxis protein
VVAERAGARTSLVLVVEDDLYNRHVMVELLNEEAGLTVRGVSSGSQALELVRESRPDVIVMDLRLPDVDGSDLCARLRSDPETRDIPAIATSALGLRALEEARAAGFAAVVEKPFDADQFLDTVRSVLAARV